MFGSIRLKLEANQLLISLLLHLLPQCHKGQQAAHATFIPEIETTLRENNVFSFLLDMKEICFDMERMMQFLFHGEKSLDLALIPAVASFVSPVTVRMMSKFAFHSRFGSPLSIHWTLPTFSLKKQR